MVDVETGATHDVMQLGANPKVFDVSFSLDGNKFSVTSMWMEWNRTLRTTGGPRLTDITYQSDPAGRGAQAWPGGGSPLPAVLPRFPLWRQPALLR